MGGDQRPVAFRREARSCLHHTIMSAAPALRRSPRFVRLCVQCIISDADCSSADQRCLVLEPARRRARGRRGRQGRGSDEGQAATRCLPRPRALPHPQRPRSASRDPGRVDAQTPRVLGSCAIAPTVTSRETAQRSEGTRRRDSRQVQRRFPARSASDPARHAVRNLVRLHRQTRAEDASTWPCCAPAAEADAGAGQGRQRHEDTSPRAREQELPVHPPRRHAWRHHCPNRQRRLAVCAAARVPKLDQQGRQGGQAREAHQRLHGGEQE